MQKKQITIRNASTEDKEYLDQLAKSMPNKTAGEAFGHLVAIAKTTKSAEEIKLMTDDFEAKIKRFSETIQTLTQELSEAKAESGSLTELVEKQNDAIVE